MIPGHVLVVRVLTGINQGRNNPWWYWWFWWCPKRDYCVIFRIFYLLFL